MVVLGFTSENRHIQLDRSASLEQSSSIYTAQQVVSNCGAAVGFCVSAAVPSVNLALSIAPALVMPQLLLGGVEDVSPLRGSQTFHTRFHHLRCFIWSFMCELDRNCSLLCQRMHSFESCQPFHVQNTSKYRVRWRSGRPFHQNRRPVPTLQCNQLPDGGTLCSASHCRERVYLWLFWALCTRKNLKIHRYGLERSECSQSTGEE